MEALLLLLLLALVMAMAAGEEKSLLLGPAGGGLVGSGARRSHVKRVVAFAIQPALSSSCPVAVVAAGCCAMMSCGEGRELCF